MSSFKPKRPTFVHWLRTSGQIADAELDGLAEEWVKYRKEAPKNINFTTGPTTWDQFVASKYPRKVLTYQAYLRLIGAAPTFNKD
jgi:hypothetical protein